MFGGCFGTVVMVLVTSFPVSTFGGSTIVVFIQATQAHSAWPSLDGRCNEYWRWSPPLMERIRKLLRTVGSGTRTASILGRTLATLAASKVNGDEFPYNGL